MLLTSLLPALAMAAGDFVYSAETVGDRLWMWAHPAGFHDNYFPASKGFKPEGGAGQHTWRSRITPVEAAVRLDLHAAPVTIRVPRNTFWALSVYFSMAYHESWQIFSWGLEVSTRLNLWGGVRAGAGPRSREP
jgi:hypothetical protein